MTEELKPREARQGEKGSPVLKILIAALVLALIAWVGAGLFGEASDPVEPTGENTVQDDATNDAGPTETPTVPE